MGAGNYRHLIRIDQPVGDRDEYGDVAEEWAEFTSVWASREDLTGQEQFAAQQFQSKVTTKFECRFQSELIGVNASMRVVSDYAGYNIVSVADPDGRRRTLVIMATRDS